MTSFNNSINFIPLGCIFSLRPYHISLAFFVKIQRNSHYLSILLTPAMLYGFYIVIDHFNYLLKEFYKLCSAKLLLFLLSLSHLIFFFCENPTKQRLGMHLTASSHAIRILSSGESFQCPVQTILPGLIHWAVSFPCVITVFHLHPL